MSRVKDNPVRLAILGTGGMANMHAESFAKDTTCRLVAACDVDAERVAAFCLKHGIPKSFSSVEEMLAGAEFDAVSIVTPDALHMPLSLTCLAAGKHVLCEKPLALRHADALQMVEAARAAGVVNMVNFSYRDWPCIQAAAEAIRAGEIGEIRHVEASYLQAWLASKAWGDWRTTPGWLWRLSKDHGSLGALGDVGVHIVDYATFPCGPVSEVFCRLKTFPKAQGDRIGAYTLDANDSAVLSIVFESGALGTIHTTRWFGGHANRLALKIAGTLGSISMDSEVSTTSYKICNGEGLDTCTWREVECPPVPTNYQRFVTAIRKGTAGEADFARGAEVQKILDACVESDTAGRPVAI